MRELLRGLLTGNFRRWGATQYRQYQAAVGHLGHTGYELEFTEYGFQSKVPPKVFDWSHGKELQWLVPTADPFTWYHQMCEVDTRLKKYNLPTTGSIHLNVDLDSRYNLPGWAKCWPIHSDTQFSNARLENKYFFGYIVHKDLILQTILFGLFLKRTRCPLQLTALMGRAYEFYSPTELTFRQDLSPLLRQWVRIGYSNLPNKTFQRSLNMAD